MSATNPLGNLILTPQQQSLLFAALNANRPAESPVNKALSLSPSSATQSPGQGLNGLQESPFLDYNYDFANDDSTLDFSFNTDVAQSQMIGDLPDGSSPETDSPDKRSHPDDEDDEEEGGAKRRESEDKVAKKPGRKPLTTEPTSKRKAQNRAAQRAFRERKEKHLKDLETKVEELEKASEASNHENKLLREKVEKMTQELNDYKRSSALASNGKMTLQNPPKPFGHSFVSNIDDVNFQFEFPKFGVLPGQNIASNIPPTTSAQQSAKRHNSDSVSPFEKAVDKLSPGNSSTYSQIGLDTPAKEDLANFSASLFNPPLSTNTGTNGSRSSFDSHFGSVGAATSTSSPSASSNSNAGGPSSSCGTSPEPFTQSPMGFKPVDTMTTIGEEAPNLNSSGQDLGSFGNIDLNNFNWLPQSNFQFEPQLFGGYREPQNNVVATGGLDDTFFNDAFDIDFTTPYNLPITTPDPKKPDLISQIDAAKSEDALDSKGQLLTCNKIWEQLQACPKVQSGDFDLDGLCSDLQKKAKCSGAGPAVDEKEFKSIVKKYLGKADSDDLDCEKAAATLAARKSSSPA